MSIIEMKVPTIGESITEVTLSQWLKGNGEYVELDEPICEFESDKATLEFPAEAAGKLIYVAAEDDDLEIGALVAKIDTSVAAPDSSAPAAEPTKEEGKEEKVAAASTEAPVKESYASGHPSPSAAKILREENVDPSSVSGSGKDGRITKDDAAKAVANKSAATPASVAAPVANSAEAPVAFSRNVRREKMSRMRRTIASRLVSAKNNTAMLTTFNEVDLTEVMKLRKTYQERFVEKNGIKLGFMSLFAKACAKVLMEMPEVNAQIDGNELIYHDFVDISIAISTPTGLVVPPVHNVESLSFAEIEKKIKGLAVKAREGTLSLDEMKGGTFTITNGGVFGSMMSTPIINEPQSAILGMHTIQQRPMAIDGEVKIRPMMYLAMSYDHRVIDGSSSVTFLVKVKQLLEDPTSLLLDL
jgi:2-oxoglutarate dehydrogenase E2 component (dihydrolipoamide succinyltransferase)